MILARSPLSSSILALFTAVPLCAQPAVDHHQHLFSPAAAAMLSSGERVFPPLTARELVTLLDSAGIRRAVVLSVAYMYGSPSRTVENEYGKVRAENDWTAEQVAAYPDRLVAFCSINPLKSYALEEIDRCAGNPHLRRGLKLHFGNSDVQLEEASHREQLKQVFRAANRHGMAMVVHARASFSRRRPYGAEQARLFIEHLLPEAPDIPVQIAHLAGAGPGYDDPPAQNAMAEFAGAVERNDSRTRNLWFDVTTVAQGLAPAESELVVRLIRQVGVERVLYGSDAATGSNLRPREGWTAFAHLPLTKAELGMIASNIAPYFK
jgi:predicted TIM-barrel fold metal-dependent hydrolase